MRHTAIVLTAFLAFTPVTACAQLDPAAPISSTAPAEFNQAKKALTAAHLVHKTTADFLVIAANSDLCKGQCAVQAKTLLDQSYAILLAADAAIVTGDAKTINDKIAAATALVGQLQSLIGRR